MARLHTRPCDDCGTPTARKRKTPAGWLCRDCARARLSRAVDELRDKSGPTFERYRQAQLAYSRSLAAGVVVSGP